MDNILFSPSQSTTQSTISDDEFNKLFPVDDPMSDKDNKLFIEYAKYMLETGQEYLLYENQKNLGR